MAYNQSLEDRITIFETIYRPLLRNLATKQDVAGISSEMGEWKINILKWDVDARWALIGLGLVPVSVSTASILYQIFSK